MRHAISVSACPKYELVTGPAGSAIVDTYVYMHTCVHVCTCVSLQVPWYDSEWLCELPASLRRPLLHAYHLLCGTISCAAPCVLEFLAVWCRSTLLVRPILAGGGYHGGASTLWVQARCVVLLSGCWVGVSEMSVKAELHGHRVTLHCKCFPPQCPGTC